MIHKNKIHENAESVISSKFTYLENLYAHCMTLQCGVKIMSLLYPTWRHCNTLHSFGRYLANIIRPLPICKSIEIKEYKFSSLLWDMYTHV